MADRHNLKRFSRTHATLSCYLGYTKYSHVESKVILVLDNLSINNNNPISMNLISAFLVLSLFAITSYSQSIDGSTLVCATSCNEYTIVDGEGGPYLWSSNIGLLDDNKGEVVTVCWESIGNAEVSVLDLSGDSGSQRTTLFIEVVSPPRADLYFLEFPICSEKDTLREFPNTDFAIFYCETVCASSIGQYGNSNIQLDSSYVTYEVTGGDIISDANERGDLTVQWGDEGFGNITVEVTNIAGCTDTKSYCIEILDNPDVTIVADLTGTVCTGQDVTLQAESDNAVSFYWSVEDEFYGSNSSAIFAFDSGGTYRIELIANTDCMCADTFFYNIEVTDRQGPPQIDCISTTHVNEAQIYYALDICSA